MKTLYLIGGTMGVGKTTVSQKLKLLSDNSVFLDGDWCWDAHPFVVNEDTRAMVMDNICHLLNNFIACPAYENIIFCWVMHEQSIIDDILSRIDVTDCRVLPISLISSQGALSERLNKDIAAGLRSPDVLARSLARIPLYDLLNTVKIDTSHMDAEEVAARISRL